METHEIADAVGDGRALESSGRALVELANARGGPDNITVILAHFDGDALAPPVRDEPVSRKPLDVEDP
jgi:protein phosphatase